MDISNNLSEKSVQMFVIGHKNFLFGQHAERSTGQRRNLQSHRDGEGEWSESVPVSDVSADGSAKAV